jgi:hypothetical protein
MMRFGNFTLIFCNSNIFSLAMAALLSKPR